MKRISKPTDYVFQVSWEVCNKVGGIYTVLSTQAKMLESIYKDNLIYIGPDFGQAAKGSKAADGAAAVFEPDSKLLAPLARQLKKKGIPTRFGRWAVPGSPIVALVDFTNLREEKNQIYADAWNDFGVDSLHAYGDYDDASLFGWQAGRMAAEAYNYFCKQEKQELKAVLQAHEWMSAFSLLYVKKHEPKMATVFTTHATSIGRSITTNGKQLYAYFEGYNGDQMAQELNMEAKHSAEKAAALQADCMTTVSELTDKECRQFLGRESDVLLPNGFEPAFSYRGSQLQTVRKRARKALLNTYNALAGTNLTDETLIISTSGRNDFICKGFDLFVNALKRVQDRNEVDRNILGVIAVPCWKKEARAELIERLANKPAIKLLDGSALEPLPYPFITHELNNFNEERLVQTILASGLRFGKEERVHILLIPSYLDGEDGIINLPYYDFLTASDYCIYPSYYEPWGYTPLESTAFSIPCLTTNLSGFGQWVQSEVGHLPLLSDGVAVIPREDYNYDHCVNEIATSIIGMARLSQDDRVQFGNAAFELSKKAQWKDFIKNYLKAYTLAIKNNGHF
ncbi:MAG: glycogen/starch synthase [Prevotellaceae bacterium]|nr:glycogen/starch synthase [Prevotellaceae bacterium]